MLRISSNRWQMWSKLNHYALTIDIGDTPNSPSLFLFLFWLLLLIIGSMESINKTWYLFSGLFTPGKKCSEEVMGYEVYTSALADVLCEPSLNMPLTVGMYARWGSGKSFVLRRLQGTAEHSNCRRISVDDVVVIKSSELWGTICVQATSYHKS